MKRYRKAITAALEKEQELLEAMTFTRPPHPGLTFDYHTLGQLNGDNLSVVSKVVKCVEYLINP